MLGLSWALLAIFLWPSICLATRDRCYGPKSPSHRVVCVLSRWTPDPPPLSVFNRSQIKFLSVTILSGSDPLTSQHLRGFSSLLTLRVVGVCSHARSCADVRGVTEIHSQAFHNTPRLRWLTLVKHPLRRLENLSGLSNLRGLTLMNMKYLSHLDMDPIRSSLRRLVVEGNNLSELKREMFKDMRRLERIRIHEPVRIIQSLSFSSLPRLSSLVLRKVERNGKPVRIEVVEKHSFFDLPRLTEIHLAGVDGRPESDSNPVCDLRSPNLSRVFVSRSSSSFLRSCRGLFTCRVCGENPDTFPQSVSLHAIFVYSEKVVRPLHLLLPAGRSSLNISELRVMDSFFNDISTELWRLPLLRSFVFQKSDATRMMGNVQRLYFNPFQFLPNPQRLREVSVYLCECDCVLLDVFKWFRNKTAVRLRLGCGNLQCGRCVADERRIGKWQDVRLLEKVLSNVCSREGVKSFDSKTMCEVRCDWRIYEDLQKVLRHIGMAVWEVVKWLSGE